jgi:hypothetical protein
MHKFFEKSIPCLVLALVLLIVSTLAGAEELAVRKYALLIGIENYDGGRTPPLRGCLNDVRLIRDLLLSSRFGFVSEDISVLLDKQASHKAILAAIDDLGRKSQKGDVVYIHYSGHGSRTPDKNGDERNETGYDSTLVPYGAGKSSSISPKNENSLDDYDILDDELDVALWQLTEKTPHVIFVADACYSGTVTRGEIMNTRGVIMDGRPHPAGMEPSLGKTREWVAVGAALDDEKAAEHVGDDNRIYGAFTWFWAKSLQAATPADTWQTVYERAKVFLRNARVTQTPLFEGNARLQVFGGRLADIPRDFMVMSVEPSGEVILNSGLFSGISAGSEFQLRHPSGALSGVTLTVRQVDLYSCVALARGGSAKIGDTAALTQWHPSFSPMKIAIQPRPVPEDSLTAALANCVQELPAYKLESSPLESRLVLRVVRAEENSDTSLPLVWFLAPDNAIFYGANAINVPLNDRGLFDLRRYLERLTRLHLLQNLEFPGDDASGSSETPVNVEYKLFVPASEEEWGNIPRGGKLEADSIIPSKWKLSRIVDSDQPELKLQDGERILKLRVTNHSSRTYYVCAFNAAPDARIVSFTTKNREVRPRSGIDFDRPLLLENDWEYIRVFASTTRDFINITWLSQEDIETRSGEENFFVRNPVDAMFDKSFRTRSGSLALRPDEIVSRANYMLLKGGAPKQR